MLAYTKSELLVNQQDILAAYAAEAYA